MGEKVVRIADLSGEMVTNPDELTGLVVTDHPELDEPRRLEVTAAQLEEIGKRAIAAVVLQQESAGDERPVRYILPLAKFTSLATGRSMEEVLADTQPVVATAVKRRS